jgi:hypothetical protein
MLLGFPYEHSYTLTIYANRYRNSPCIKGQLFPGVKKSKKVGIYLGISFIPP